MAKDPKKYKRKKKLGSYHYVSVIFSAALALFVIGLFGTLILQANKLTSIIKQNIELQVYLNKDISNSQRSRIEREIASSDYILLTNGKAEMTFISKEEAAQQFVEDTGEDFTEFLGDNPLRDALTIKINESHQSNDDLETIKSQIQRISGVFEVTYVKNLADSINDNLAKLSLLLIGIATVLVIVVLLLINNAIKLALFSQRFLIRSMQLVGAKSSFIRMPFLKRSLLHGALAGLIASGLLYGLKQFANGQVKGLEQLQQQELVIALYGLLIALGAIIAYFSTLRAMNKYLKMSLDELY
ncbi:ABC transporter permease [Roseivirga sp. E12]|uniref:cell division protein FtsX n=1 Tax=Roseivirga sp. E12 TaxID=2819237 RepID=UPI001ABC6EB9|nr:permease-like cell division protein FtsX [Roseivirga sp. E12]MBO3697759.1 permease-like cell division protein FtsX [Roseivirga sp. E12]